MKPSETAFKTPVWLIEDHADFRKMVAWQIEQIEGLCCPRAFATCEEALEALRRDTPPKVILCDIGSPGMDGIEGIKRIKASHPSVHVVVLTVYDDHNKVFNAVCAGASGYLLKNSSEENLAKSIQEVLRGGAPMNPRVAKLVLDAFASQNRPAQSTDYGLTPREKEILELMVKGMILKEIAERLGVSPHTVNNQLRSIYEKLHVHTRGGVVAKAIREKLY